ARYWVQTIRFLARGKLEKGRGVELAADRREYRRGETVQLRARFLDSQLAPAAGDVIVLMESPGQARRRVNLLSNPAAAGVYEARLTDLPDGQYQLLMTEPQHSGHPVSAQFTVVAPPGEFARPEMDARALAAAAETTRGKFFTLADADQILN